MRLLNTENGDMEEFFGDYIPSKYAILSHRWGDNEVSFQDWAVRSSRPDVRSRDSYRKIQTFCEIASDDDIAWAWVDTCCIDKTSSQELSEAINSMFEWYRNAFLCYAFLEDCNSNTFDVASLGDCAWFTRGWTLQELIAPREVKFYNRRWQLFGLKSNQAISEVISEITTIDTEFLLGSDLESASIAKKMSWASKRKTTRLEDTAYCLLGIFDINMPLLYGEGPKAFKRLQEEILKLYPMDHSLYAWGTPVERCSVQVLREDRKTVDHRAISPEPLAGLLARSPRDFEFSRRYSPIPRASHFFTATWEGVDPVSYPETFGKGVRIALPVIFRTPFYYQFSEPSVYQIRSGFYGLLLCQDDTDEQVTLCVPLLPWGSGFFARTGELYRNRSLVIPTSINHLWKVYHMSRPLKVVPERKARLRAGDVLLRSILDLRASESGTPRLNIDWSYLVNPKERVTTDSDDIIRVRPHLSARYYAMTLKQHRDVSEMWSIVLGRVNVENLPLPAFQAGIVPSSNNLDGDFICDKVFQCPSDNIAFDVERFPRTTIQVEIEVERHSLPVEGEFIDMVDIAIRDRPVHEDNNNPAEKAHNDQIVHDGLTPHDEPAVYAELAAQDSPPRGDHGGGIG